MIFFTCKMHHLIIRGLFRWVYSAINVDKCYGIGFNNSVVFHEINASLFILCVCMLQDVV